MPLPPPDARTEPAPAVAHRGRARWGSFRAPGTHRSGRRGRRSRCRAPGASAPGTSAPGVPAALPFRRPVLRRLLGQRLGRRLHRCRRGRLARRRTPRGGLLGGRARRVPLRGRRLPRRCLAGRRLPCPRLAGRPLLGTRRRDDGGGAGFPCALGEVRRARRAAGRCAPGTASGRARRPCRAASGAARRRASSACAGRAGGDAVEHPARPVDADEHRGRVARCGRAARGPTRPVNDRTLAPPSRSDSSISRGQVRPQLSDAGRGQRAHRQPTLGQHHVHGLQPAVAGGLDGHRAAGGHRHPDGAEVDQACRRPVDLRVEVVAVVRAGAPGSGRRARCSVERRAPPRSSVARRPAVRRRPPVACAATTAAVPAAPSRSCPPVEP